MKMSSTEPSAYGLLAGICFFWMAMLVITCGACRPHTDAINIPLGERDARTVIVQQFCIETDPFVTKVVVSGGRGSGVILDGRIVLTAYHVVECPHLNDIHIVTSAGKRVSAKVTKTWPGRDIAQVTADEDIGVFPPLEIAPPEKIGEVVCSASAVPERGGTCGEMLSYQVTPTCPGTWCHDTQFAGEAIAGNSGSGMYNGGGALVGILTGGTLIPFTQIPMSGAYGSALWPIRDEVR